MSTLPYRSGRSNGTFARPYTHKNWTITKRLHSECSHEYCLVAEGKMLECFYGDDSHQSSFTCPFQTNTNKGAIPCGLI